MRITENPSRTSATLQKAGFSLVKPKLKKGWGCQYATDDKGVKHYKPFPPAPKDANKRFYENRFKLAIVDALNILGTPQGKDGHHCECEGCDYEKGEAIDILYSALGLIVDYKHPLKSYDEFTRVRQLVWDSSDSLSKKERKK